MLHRICDDAEMTDARPRRPTPPPVSYGISAPRGAHAFGGHMTYAEHHRERAPVGAPRKVAAPPPAVMTPPDRYVLRMVVFLAIVGVVAVGLHEHAARFFMRNPPLNVLILSVLAAGIVQSFRAVQSLQPAIAWVEGYRRGDPRVRAESG